MKMCELFTARYSDRRTAYEKPLDWIYANRRGAKVIIEPTIWLWQAKNTGVYFVDYVGAGVGCTCGTFDELHDAEILREKLGRMEENEFEAWLLNKWRART